LASLRAVPCALFDRRRLGRRRAAGFHPALKQDHVK
jgi:hypothetical protein